MKRVLITQHRLLHYRVGFFSLLKTECQNRGIFLDLLHGQASRRELIKRDEGHIPWATKVRNIFFEIGERDLLWQPMPPSARSADLIVLMQENRIVSNYYFLLSRLWSSRKVAYWGHGLNFQSSSPSGIRERWKRFLLKKVDWWFAYTRITADLLITAGYPSRNISCLNNAIDNEAFAKDLREVTDQELHSVRRSIDMPKLGRLGLFCGSLYADKKLDFLLAAADRIHDAVPGFRMVIVGDGPSLQDLQDASASRSWLTCVGMKRGREKAAYFRLADVVLNPGLVGLHILDSFCAGVPMVTTAGALHSPEVAYLRDGFNGVMVAGGIDEFAQSVCALLQDEEQLNLLKRGALRDSHEYTMAKMVSNFADGIESCLAEKEPYRS